MDRGPSQRVWGPQSDCPTRRPTQLKEVIHYKFYRKDIANKTPFTSRSAGPQKDKIQQVSQEFIRRFRNTSRQLQVNHINEVISNFCQDLKRGGFDHTFISTSLRAATAGYLKMVRADLKGEIPMNRPHHYEARRRRQKKLRAKSNWFKK